MNQALIAVAGGYALMGVLLLSLNVASRWRWWIKVITTGVTAAFFVVSFYGVKSLVGWPSDQRVPAQFQLHWGTVTEPDKFMGDPGAIFLWVEALDDRNMPTGIPRAHKLPYSKELAEKVMKARAKIEQGIQQAGSAESLDEAGEKEEGESSAENEKRASQAREGDGGGNRDPEALLNRNIAIDFTDLPPPILEKKPGL
jgi:hypothetical protein